MRRQSKIICPRCNESGGAITQRKAGNAKTTRYFYIKHFDKRAKNKNRSCYIGRSSRLARITIVDERYAHVYKKNIRHWNVSIREEDIKENLDLTRKALNLLVDMGFPERFAVQKFVADMGSEWEDFGFYTQSHEKYRFSLLNFTAFIQRYNELYKNGAAIKRLNNYKKSYFNLVS